jgi:hypothetical protein
MAEEALMAGLLNFNEIPNLLELAEDYRSDLSVISELSESATCDEKTGGLAEPSVCADKG